ncbi:type II toxin-antitoxin system RelE/ParE family toxin [Ciceribacter sp. T2.26MG-112.2]|uniref:type II toxin-antitoxin system RelE/ParE family toxin n=1 Tax=Ciceribacter sp. T2.26MG-112.2 TaxID=3137154 RepID=UPI0012B6998B|nr:type II toxin-antitoxin system RelE/ParE family toxin [Ciceribacter naphthalenivorans]
MARLRYLDSARADFLSILDYVYRESGDVALARQFVEKLRGHCRHLASLPGNMGRPQPELRPDVRSVAFGSYMIFFRYVGDDFQVINVLEGHRDIDAYFGKTE